MNSLTDQQLLRDYAARRSETAFAELVRRHVDLVYSAALRMVCDAHLAEDVTQGVFAALAQNARKLTERAVLSGWLHRTAQNLAANAVRSEVRRRVREQEAATMNELLGAEPDAHWESIAPQLDAALGELSEPDRDAVLLRYFERKSASEIAQRLGISDDAAQKRVSRAVERLRESFAKSGITVGAGGLVLVLSANAVQAAPAGLAVSITTAALAGSAVSTVLAANKIIAMTIMQKTLLGVTLAAVVGTGVYELQQNSKLRDQVQTLRQQQAPLAEQIQQLQSERDAATRRLSAMGIELTKLDNNTNKSELLKLRGQMAMLRADGAKKAEPDKSWAQMVKSPQMKEFMKVAMSSSIDKTYAKLFADLHLTPEQSAALKELVVQKGVAGMDASADMVADNLDATQRAKLAEQSKAEKDDLDQQIKALLGADGFARYQEYEKTSQDRAMISGPTGFEEQLAGGAALTPDQTEQLIQAMSEERAGFKFSTDYSDKSKMVENFTDDNISRHLQEEEQLDQHYSARAQTILSPDQLAAFQKFLVNHQQIQAMMLQANAKMLGAKPGGN